MREGLTPRNVGHYWFGRARQLKAKNIQLAKERREAIAEARRFEEAYQLIYHKLQVAQHKLEDTECGECGENMLNCKCD